MRAFLIGLLLCLVAGTSLAAEGGISEKRKNQLIEACAAAAASVYEPDWRHIGFEIDQIDPTIAIPTCETAFAAAPCCMVVRAWLAHAYLARGQWGDREAAMPLLESAAASGNVLAMALLAEILTDDLATPREIARAAMLARRAAEEGFVPGQYLLGKMLHGGVGIPVDDVEAAAGSSSPPSVASRRRGSCWPVSISTASAGRRTRCRPGDSTSRRRTKAVSMLSPR